MGNLKNNIDHYMELKEIKMYSHLLVNIARELGIRGQDAYKLPVEKDNVPFNKGFRYYAYLDDSKLYKEEFNLLLAKNGESILTQTDEFGKTFLDYVVEYHSVNGIRYLYEEYGIKLNGYFSNNFKFRKDSGITWCKYERCGTVQ